jgi:hypothetical protein
MKVWLWDPSKKHRIFHAHQLLFFFFFFLPLSSLEPGLSRCREPSPPAGAPPRAPLMNLCAASLFTCRWRFCPVSQISFLASSVAAQRAVRGRGQAQAARSFA